MPHISLRTIMCSPRAKVNQFVNGETAFDDFKIDSYDILDEVEGRLKCPNCSRSRKFFCYTCFIVPDPSLAAKLPRVKLPLYIDIVKHPQEIDGKSTATHGPILAPESVRIFTYPDLPDTEKSILIFPSDDAEDAADFMDRVKKENGGTFPYERVLFIDSTWNQTYKISHDPKIINLPRVKITGIESLFWRYQRGNPTTHLATIEAVYYFTVIHHRTCISEDYKGEYDNLLFFFRYMFNKIRQLYDPKKLLAYSTRPHLM